MKQKPGGHKFEEDVEMGTAIDTRLIKRGGVLAATGNRKYRSTM